MKKGILLGITGLVISFFVVNAVASAQTATVTPSAAPTTAVTTPGAPNTGFGN